MPAALDSPSVFGAMLDRDAGGFGWARPMWRCPARALPARHDGARDQLGDATGWMVVRDVLCIGPVVPQPGAVHTHRRSPTDYDAEHVLLRTVRCVQGWAEIHLDCEPVFDYGGLAAEWSYTGHGYNEAHGRSEGRT